MAKKVTFVRHGKAEKIMGSGNEAELARSLTEEGFAEVVVRRTSLGEPVYDLVLSSPAVRAQQTANIIAGSGAKIVTLGELWPSEGFMPKLDSMYEKLGHATLHHYLAHELGGALLDSGIIAWRAVQDASSNKNARTVLVVGHFPLLLATGYVPTMCKNAAAMGQIGDMMLAEAQGFTLLLDDAGHVIDCVLHQ